MPMRPIQRQQKSQLTSAKEYATHSERADIPSQDQTITAGPPATIPTISVPPSAVQLVTIEKLKPIMPIKLKERLSSIFRSENDQSVVPVLWGCDSQAYLVHSRVWQGGLHCLWIRRMLRSSGHELSQIVAWLPYRKMCFLCRTRRERWILWASP